MINMIDIGCRGGISAPWSEKYIKNLLCIDPQPFNTPKFANLMNICVFDQDGEREFYVTQKRDCSSLFKPDYKQIRKHFGVFKKGYRIVDTISVECKRLDKIIENDRILYDFLKTDLQGADLNAIKSCGDKIKMFAGIQAEALSVPIYKESPLAKELLTYMKEMGFIATEYLHKSFFSDYIFLNENTDKLDKISLIKRMYNL